MEWTPALKRRIAIFGAGALIGVVFAYALIEWTRESDATITTGRTVTVVLSTCDLDPGDTLTAECASTREVASRLAPPQTLMADDLDWHVGRKLEVAVPTGSAFRTVDFEPATSEERERREE